MFEVHPPLDPPTKYYVDVPNPALLHTEEKPYQNLATFSTWEEAIVWAMENLGADEEGKIQVVTG